MEESNGRTAYDTVNNVVNKTIGKVKPGYITSEGQSHFVFSVFSLLVFYGVVTNEEANLWMILIAAIPPLVQQMWYTYQRTTLKKESMK